MVAEPKPPGVEDEAPKAPWHFKLLLVLVIAYLAWRTVQIIGWIVT